MTDHPRDSEGKKSPRGAEPAGGRGEEPPDERPEDERPEDEQPEDETGREDLQEGAEASDDAGSTTGRPAWVDEDPFPGEIPVATFKTGTIETVEVDPALPSESIEPPARDEGADDRLTARRDTTRRMKKTKTKTKTKTKNRKGATTTTPGKRRARARRPEPRKDEDDRNREVFEEDIDTDPGYRRRWRFWGLPIWGWILAITTSLSVFFLVMDIRNRNRFLMVCKTNKMELHKGRTFPWPFGHSIIGGPQFKPVTIPAEADCRRREFSDRQEAELGFLGFVLAQIRTGLANPGSANLRNARQLVHQAMMLTRTHRKHRKETKKLLAELAYREARAGLARAENELRTALDRFQEASRLDEDRYDNLGEWISYLETILKSVSPSPGTSLSSPPGAARTLPPSILAPPLPTRRSDASPPAGKTPGAPAPSDAGAPATSGGGILM